MKIIFLISSWLGIATYITGCGDSQAETKKDITAVPTPAKEVFSLHKGSLSSTLSLPGELTAFQQVDLYAKVNSFVEELYVDVGSEVNTGQLLARMEAPELNSQLEGAESQLKSQQAVYTASKANYDRMLETSKTPGTVSPNDLDFANSQQRSNLEKLDAAQAAYQEIADTRNYLEIRAPFSGVISARNVSAGAYVGPAGMGSKLPLYTLQEQKKLRLIVSIPELYSTSVKNQETIQFTVKSIPGQTFTAKVARLAGALDLTLRAQHVEMDVINNDIKVLPGMITEVNIPLTDNLNSFVVPSTAVLNSTTGVFVIRATRGKLSWIPIQTGRSNGNQTEIFGELSPGDSLMNRVTEEMRDGAPVGNITVKN
jgi:RND family efflux transporter MFP subunit